jgi:RNA polymerase sigma-70 factor, ECF subfamily
MGMPPPGQEREDAAARIVDRQQTGDRSALDESLRRLEPERERRCCVVERRYFGGMSVEETAEALDISPAT